MGSEQNSQRENIMTETAHTARTLPATDHTAVRTGLPSRTRETPGDALSRFHGDGVRYKAKLIGIDQVPVAQGEKMCFDSMMKLKGCEAAARKQGKHKLRIWLKVSSSGLRILDERTGIVIYEHDRKRISSLTKDESDPRALAYIYQHQDAYELFYIKMANQADPVLIDIKEVCQREEPEALGESTETQNVSLVALNDSLSTPSEKPLVTVQGAAPEDVFSPRPESSPRQTNQVSAGNELMEVFLPQLEEPLALAQSSCTSQPESPRQTLSTAQILSMFPMQPVGGSPYNSPPFSPTTVPWGQQGPLGSQWAGHWLTTPATPAWVPPGVTAPPAGSQLLTYSMMSPQPGFIMGGGTAPAPNENSNPLMSLSSPTRATGAQGSPTSNNSHLG
ncbi:disabled homolog 2 [Nothobranchius furzeri]|uniref:Disabled homolog 2-like n=1 Tax=Nothobranchius furzeri TaxID=105023 RepID=A0A8C6MIF6_NOTFU|nr:disabled-like protein 2-like [Nothobranchius furzeri]